MRLLFRWVHMQAITSGRVLRIRAEMFKIKRVNRNIKKILVHILVALFVIFLIHPGRFSTLSMNIVSQDIVKLFAKKFSKSKDPLYSCSHALCSPKNSGIKESLSTWSPIIIIRTSWYDLSDCSLPQQRKSASHISSSHAHILEAPGSQLHHPRGWTDGRGQVQQSKVVQCGISPGKQTLPWVRLFHLPWRGSTSGEPGESLHLSGQASAHVSC